MDEFIETKHSRSKIASRLIFTILCLIALYMVQFVIQIISLLQFAILLITREHSEPLRKFSNKAVAYSYRLMRYVTLNENLRPFPFSEFPSEMEPPEDSVKFD